VTTIKFSREEYRQLRMLAADWLADVRVIVPCCRRRLPPPEQTSRRRSEMSTEDDEDAKPSQKRKSGAYGRGAVRKRRGVFFIRYTCWDPAKRKRRRVEEPTDAENITRAREILDERLGDRAKGATPAAMSRTRLKELFDDVRHDYVNKSQRVEILENRWQHIEAHFGAGELAKRITHDRMQRYIDARREEKAADATIEHEVAALRHMLRLGYKNRKVAQLPVFPTIKADRVRMVFFDDDEIERLDKALEEELADGRDVGNDWLPVFITVVRWTGMRRDELLDLERRSLDLDAGKITLDPGTTKTKEGRVIYLPPEAHAALKEWDEKTKALEREKGIIVRNVFHRRGKPIREFPYDIWHSACARASLAGRRLVHDFRRTAARAYRRAGVSEGVAMKILGHKTRSIFERYDIKNEDDLREAAALVATGKIGGNIGGRVAQVASMPKSRSRKSVKRNGGGGIRTHEGS
jgi:integrase